MAIRSFNTYLLLVVAILFTGCHSSAEREWVQEDGYRWAELYPEGSSMRGFMW
ncbi:MAG: hypothetical protein RI573_13495 [Balneolaceae bacterium]|nr:hypothetical protein [Balneolaceae bacterium]